jgi:hypothetical protein
MSLAVAEVVIIAAPAHVASRARGVQIADSLQLRRPPTKQKARSPYRGDRLNVKA